MRTSTPALLLLLAAPLSLAQISSEGFGPEVSAIESGALSLASAIATGGPSALSSVDAEISSAASSIVSLLSKEGYDETVITAIASSAEATALSLAGALATGGSAALSSVDAQITSIASVALSALSSIEASGMGGFGNMTASAGNATSAQSNQTSSGPTGAAPSSGSSTGNATSPIPTVNPSTGAAAQREVAGLWMAGAVGATVLGLAALL